MSEHHGKGAFTYSRNAARIQARRKRPDLKPGTYKVLKDNEKISQLSLLEQENYYRLSHQNPAAPVIPVGRSVSPESKPNSYGRPFHRGPRTPGIGFLHRPVFLYIRPTPVPRIKLSLQHLLPLYGLRYQYFLRPTSI